MLTDKFPLLKAAWLSVILMFLVSPYVQAATPACGTTLTSNTKLDSNMDCAGTALRLIGNGSKNVTLNCDGYSISTINGSAIFASDVKGITIKNCSISATGRSSRGIELTNGTSKSLVTNNDISVSGIYSRAIEINRGASANKITGNTLNTSGGSASLRIRFADKNTVSNNTIEADASYAIAISSASKNNVSGNTLMSPEGWVYHGSYGLQNGGLGVDGAGNIYAVENDWGSSAGFGTATASFMVDPSTGTASSILPVLMGGNDVGHGFDALDVMPDGRLLALAGDNGSSASVYEIDAITREVTVIALNLPALDGKPNGLEATSDTTLLATTNEGELLNIDLTTGDVTIIGTQATGWTDLATHPTSGKTYAISRRKDEASGTAHLYEIDIGDGQIVTEIGDTGQADFSSIDFALDETLYGNTGQSGLVSVDTATGLATVIGGFGPDPLEPLSRKNKLINNLMQAPEGSITFPGSIMLPSVYETDISSERARIGANEAEVDSTALPFLDESARITLDNLTGTYRNLLVDPEDDGSFESCAPPQCKLVSFIGGTLIFDVKGFTTYSSEVNTDPTLLDVATAMPAEIEVLLAEPGLSKSAKQKLKSARSKMAKAVSHLKKDKVKDGLTEISKAVKDLEKAENEGAATGDLVDRLAAVITRANATTLVANVISNVSTSGSIASREAESKPSHSTDQVRLAQRLNRHLRGLLPQAIAARSSTSRIVARTVEIDETTRCDSGSFRIKGTLNHEGKGTFTIIFRNCRYDDETLNGKLKMRNVLFDLDDFFIKEAVISFSNLVMKTPTLSVLLDGSIKTKTNVGKNTERLTINMAVQDKTTGKVTLAVNLVVVDVYNDIYSPSSYTETIDGRLYDSEHGFVDVTMLVPFDFSTITQQFPDSGQLLLAGSLNSTILVTVISDTHIRLELDLDGDTTFEIVAIVNWAELETEPDLADTDGDGMHDAWEQTNGLDPFDPGDATLDNDLDGFTSIEEYVSATDPNDFGSIPPHADLSIIKTTSPSAAVIGDNLTYTLTVSNDGPQAANSVVVTDTLSTDLVLNSAI